MAIHAAQAPGVAKARAAEFVVGLVFGLGLLVSGMTDPGKVKGFLDVFGRWDPSLALVMGGAVGVGLLGFAWVNRRGRTWLGGSPLVRRAEVAIDARLLVGSALFGVGWGLAGFCPGPAVVALGTGAWQALVFCAAMVAGMALHDRSATLPAAPPSSGAMS